MNWQEVRNHYPDEWVLVEAILAHTEGDKRILDDLAVINTYPDGMTGFQAYREFHRSAPSREYLVLHTSRTDPDIRVRYGIRRYRC